jgi:hypothetical protein
LLRYCNAHTPFVRFLTRAFLIISMWKSQCIGNWWEAVPMTRVVFWSSSPSRGDCWYRSGLFSRRQRVASLRDPRVLPGKPATAILAGSFLPAGQYLVYLILPGKTLL